MAVRGVTSDELRVTSLEESALETALSPAMGGQESALTPAMREWRRKLAAGYTIRARLRAGRKGQAYLEWGPALYNPEGVFVKNIRRDTLRKMMRLGILSDERRVTSDELGSGGQGMDGINDASTAGEPARRHLGGDSEQPGAVVVSTGCGAVVAGGEAEGGAGGVGGFAAAAEELRIGRGRG